MDFIEKLPFLVLILCLSLLGNLLVPFAIYFRKFGRNGYQGQGGCDGWGVIMDGVLAGAINPAMMNFLLEIKPKIVWPDLTISLVFGFLAMLSMHAWMSLRKWQAWIMPKPWRWNSGGYWHMVSATLQMGFLAYQALLVVKDSSLFDLSLTKITFGAVLLLTVAFVGCLNRDKMKTWIGRF